jgi:hypothetical protein
MKNKNNKDRGFLEMFLITFLTTGAPLPHESFRVGSYLIVSYFLT